MISSKAVGAGAFVVIGLLLFAVALFMIGDRRMLFERRFTVYSEFTRGGELEPGAPVRVAGGGARRGTGNVAAGKPAGKVQGKDGVAEAAPPGIQPHPP